MEKRERAARSCPVRRVEEVEWPTPETNACPYPYYDALRADSPVFKYPGRNEYLVSRWADVVHVARHPELFSHMINQADPALERLRSLGEEEQAGAVDRPYTPYGMASSDPPEHKAKRALGLPLFSKERMRRYESIIRSHAEELVDRWIERGSCEFIGEFAEILPTYVIADALGLPREDAPLFMRFGRSESQGARYFSEEKVASEAALFREAADYMKAALVERRERPRDDFLSEFIAAQIERDGVFDLDYLAAEGVTLLLAGNVTTAHMLASAMATLMERPDVLAEVRADRSLALALCEETLRIESPLQWHLRVCREDTTIGEVPIPAGAFVIVLYGSANRDELRFEEADRFDLRRAALVKHSLAFGYGPHRCLGAPLARLEGQIAFDVLLSRLDEIRLVAEESDLTCIDSTRFRAPKRLTLAFQSALQHA